jgi:23S rRNA pseudouridine1911/1915/1917 synthase
MHIVIPISLGMTMGGTNVEVPLGAAQIGLRIDRAIADVVPSLSRERIKALLAEGALSDASGQPMRVNPSTRVEEEALLQLAIPASISDRAGAEALDLDIVYEDADLIVINKPAGMVVHPAAGNPDGTLVNALLHHCAGQLSGIGGVQRPGIVHRIDKDTSGLIVAAKTDRAHDGLSRQFANHSITRAYLAIVTGRPLPPSGTIDAPLGRSDRDRKKMAVVPVTRGKRAVTHYQTIETLRDASLVRCHLETGRTHQVRVHMTHIGHPLLGDPVYSRTRKAHAEILRSQSFERQALHAARLGFIHPENGNMLDFTSELPDDMQELLNRLRVSVGRVNP